MTEQEFDRVKTEVYRNQCLIEEAYGMIDKTKANALLRGINDPDADRRAIRL